MIAEYIKHGWALTAIPYGSKNPIKHGWNLIENKAKSVDDIPPGYGVGLLHAYSGTMALDIDNWDECVYILSLNGIDVEEMVNREDSVSIYSRPGRLKLLFRMPPSIILRTKRVTGKDTTVFELRCATSEGLSVQDVLPPSIHPTTREPYEWGGNGSWENLPLIPQNLLEYWEALISPKRHISTPQSDQLQDQAEYDEPVVIDWVEVETALSCISPECSRSEWVIVGMALHWGGCQTDSLDLAFGIWNKWSALSTEKYPGLRDVISQWESFKADKRTGIQLGSLFHMARKNGWKQYDTAAIDQAFLPVSEPLPPVTLHNGFKLNPPGIDLSLWPPSLALRAVEVSDIVGCDPLVPLWSGLAAVCAVVDSRIRLELMPGFKVPPILWLMTIGDPADKKSPGSRPMMEILKQIELEDRPRYAQALLQWEGQEAAHAAAKKHFLNVAASPEAIMGLDALPEVPELPPQPPSLRLSVSDVTSQKLIRLAADRPRGMLCFLDEMNSWVKKLTDKTSGEDRSAWVVSYESEHYEMDRVGAGSIRCDNLAVSIYGNIQPRVFRQSFRALADDGLLQRFLPVTLTAEKTKLGQPIPDFLTSKHTWDGILRLLYSLPVTNYELSHGGFIAFRNFQVEYETMKREERMLQTSDVFMTAFGKIEGTLGRLILLFHLIEAPFSQTVSKNLVERVIQIVKGFIIPSLRYVLSEVAETNTFDHWVYDYVIQNCHLTNVTLSDIRRSGRRRLEHVPTWKASEMVIKAMHTLEDAFWVRREDDGSAEHRHQAKWSINPTLIKHFEAYRRTLKGIQETRSKLLRKPEEE